MGKRKLDRFDLEAEREGNAILNGNKRSGPVGKRLARDARRSNRGDVIRQTRAERRHVVDPRD